VNTVQKIAKNTTVLLVAQVASYLLAFLYIMYTARYLGPASFGIISFALAFTGIFAVFSDLGLRPLTIREVARDKSLASIKSFIFLLYSSSSRLSLKCSILSFRHLKGWNSKQ